MTVEAETTTETPEATSVSETAPEGQPSEAAPATPDISEELANIRKQLEALTSDEEPDEPVPSLADLLGSDEELFYEDDDELGQDEPAVNLEQTQSDLEARLADLQQRLDEREEYEIAEFMQARTEQLNALTEKYPELKDKKYVDKEIVPKLREIAALYDNPALINDPELVETVYLADRARKAAAHETPAESGRENGAVLETQASASGRSADEDYAAKAAREIVEAGRIFD